MARGLGRSVPAAVLPAGAHSPRHLSLLSWFSGADHRIRSIKAASRSRLPRKTHDHDRTVIQKHSPTRRLSRRRAASRAAQGDERTGTEIAAPPRGALAASIRGRRRAVRIVESILRAMSFAAPCHNDILTKYVVANAADHSESMASGFRPRTWPGQPPPLAHASTGAVLGKFAMLVCRTVHGRDVTWLSS